MSIPSWYDPTRQWTVYIPARTDGSGVCGLHMTAGNMQYFQLDKFPPPREQRVRTRSEDMRLFSMPVRNRGANNGSYRIAYKWVPGKDKPLSCRFRLSGQHKMETLKVIADYLNTTDVEWLHIANHANNNIWRSAFSSNA